MWLRAPLGQNSWAGNNWGQRLGNRDTLTGDILRSRNGRSRILEGKGGRYLVLAAKALGTAGAWGGAGTGHVLSHPSELQVAHLVELIQLH